MKTNALIQHLETQNCKKCKVKGLCDQAGGEECLLPKMAAQALRDLTESLQRLRKDKADLQHNLMVAEADLWFRVWMQYLRMPAEGVSDG